MPDIAGNSLATATPLNLTSTVQSFPDLVTATASDYYRFNLATRSSLNLSLTGLDANANIELLDSSGNPLSVNGVPQTSTNSGNLSELINTTLNPGLYYIRISPAPAIATVNYTLNISRDSNLPISDIVWRNAVQEQSGVWTLNGTSFVSATGITPALGAQWTLGGTGDFNGDGQSDIIWRDAANGVTGIWLMNGATLISAVQLNPGTPLGSEWTVGGTGDFNGDGQTDILWRDSRDGLTGVWYMNGTNFVAAASLNAASLGSQWAVGAVADFNGDGKVDIVWRDEADSLAGIWLMDGINYLSAVSLPNVEPGWRINGAADFNQDGNPDLLWRYYGPGGQTGIWIMNGTTRVDVASLPAVDDPNWTPSAPYIRPGVTTAIDEAGGDLATAFDLGSNLTGLGTYQAVIGGTDTDDYYRFNLGTASQVNLALGGAASNLVALQLLDSTGNLVPIAANGSTAIAGSLAAGTYYVRAFPNGAGASTPYALSVSVDNLPVIVTNRLLSVNEQGTANLSSAVLQATDGDNTAAQLAYSLGSLPTQGTLSINGAIATVGAIFSQTDLNDGTRIQYTHNGSETTSDSFSFSLSDGAGGAIAAQLFSIAVTPVNDPPVLSLTSTQSVDQNTNTLINPIQITDPDVSPGEVTVTLAASQGVLTLGRTAGLTFLNGDGSQDASFSFRGALDVVNFDLRSLIYRSNATFEGIDTVSVTVNDGGNTGIGGPKSDSKTITLTVSPVNDPPVLTVPTGQVTVNEDTSSPIFGISAADSDAGTGIVTASITAANGVLTLGTTVGLTITTGKGFQDKNTVFSGTLGAVNAALNGLVYQGDLNYNGADTITLSLSDNGNTGNGIPLSDAKVISLVVTPVNDAPIVTVPAAQTANESTDLLINGVSVNDVDAGSGNLTVSLSTGNGKLSLASTAGLAFSAGDGTQDGTLIFTGTQGAVNNALSTLTYRGNPNFNGADTVSVSVNDGGNTGNGIPLSDAGKIDINVLGINTAPVITLPTTPPAVSSDTDIFITGISVADADAGGGLLSVTLLAENGLLTLQNSAGLTFTQGDGTSDNRMTFSGDLATINSALSRVTYHSYPGFTNAFDRVTLSVNDNGNSGIGVALSDTKTLFVNVGGAVNQNPIANSDFYSVQEEALLNGSSILVNDTDPDFTQPLTAQLVAGPANAANFTLNANGTFSYTPTLNFNGTDGFTYVTRDALGGTSNTAIVQISVSPINDPPVAVNDAFGGPEDQPISGNVLSNDTDVDNTSAQLTTQLATGPINALSFALNSNGTFNYTPKQFFNGSDRFTYLVLDPSGAVSNTATVALTITSVNNPPTATNDGIYTVSAGGLLSVTGSGVLTNDTDIDSPVITAVVASNPTNGTLSLNPNGSFTYRPTGTFSGIDSFTYRASDGSLSSNLATVTISVAPNNAPVATGDSFSISEDSPLTAGNVLTNDTDADGNLPLTASVVANPINGTLNLSSNGTFTYTPTLNFNGTDSFTYVAVDSLGAASTPATVQISVAPVNDAPVANNDTLSVSPGGSLNIIAPGILSNDTDVDSPTITAALVSTTPNGTLSFSSDGSGAFTYRPNAGFAGTDSFTYRASDGSALSNTATVTIVVDASANTLPIAKDDGFTTSEDTALTTGNVLANDTDFDNNLPLTASLVVGPANALSFALNPDGTFNYTPKLNFNGTDSFTYIAKDSVGGASSVAIATFTITPVNDAPTALNDNYTVNQTAGLTATVPGVLSNDTDVDNPTLSAVLLFNTSNGTLNLSADGSFTYTPNAGFVGTDSFTYQASDGSLSSNTAIVNLTVVTVTNAVPIANPDTFTTAEDTLLSTGNVLTNDTDTDSTLALTASVITAPSHALSFTLNADGTFNYTPALNFNGTDTFVYAAKDSQGGVSNPATVTFSVTPVNDAPIATNDSYVVKPTAVLTASLGNSVLSNDSDVDGPTLSAILVSNVTAGTLTFNTVDGTFTYTPNAGFTGTDSFTYQASDGSLTSNLATATISVTSNVPPIANPDTFTTAEDTLLNTGNVLTNDTDTDSTLALTASVITAPSHALSFTLNADGTFNYTPALNFNGTDTFVYAAKDSQGGVSNPATVTFSVTPVNDAPTVVNQTFVVNAGTPSLTISAPGVLTNSTDPENDPLSASVIANPTSGVLALDSTGSFTYTPNSGFVGIDRFTYLANDGTLNSNTATVTVRVNSVPVASNDTYTAIAGSTLNVSPLQGILANDTDADSVVLTAAVITSPVSGTLITLNTDGSFIYTPNSGFLGTDSFTYQAGDGFTTSNLATVNITVRTNSAPVALNDSYPVATNGSIAIGSFNGVLSNDTDAETPSSQLTATTVAAPTHGTLNLSANGSFTYTPTAGFQGTDSFTYRASDGLTTSNLATVTLSISPNNPPVANNDSYTAFSGIPLSKNALTGVRANDTDADGNSLTISKVSDPAHGTLSLNADGSFVYTPTSGYTGPDSFTYSAFDGIASSTATVALSVRQETAPQPQSDTYSAITGQTLTITAPGVLTNDTDAEGDPISAQSLFSPNANGILSLKGDGSFTYISNPGFIGTDFFTYQASDGSLTSAPVTITINVGNNAPPTAQPDSYSVNQNNFLVVPKAIGVLANDSDPNTGQQLNASVVSGPSQGSLTLSPDGSFVYLANATASGTDSFTYLVSDGSLTSTAVVALTIKATSTAPAVQNDIYTISANTPLTVTASGVLTNDTDAENDFIQAAIATPPSQGSVTLNANGSFTYVPNNGFQGTDSFTYRASDGIQTSTPATVFITVGGVNSAPVVTVPSSQLIVQNTDLLIPTGLSISDADAGSSAEQITLSAANGVLSLGSISGLTFTTGDGTSDPTMVFTGALASINTALQNLKFTPTNGFTGSTQITLVANDQGATGTGGAKTGTGTVTVNVSSGATLVTNIAPGSANSSPTNLVAFGNTVYLSAGNSANGTELWKSGGTGASTNQVADINSGGLSSSPSNLTVIGSMLYFTATNSVSGTELWKTDLSTGTGATLVSDLRTGSASSSPGNLVNLGGTLFFRANDGSGNALFKLDSSGNPVKVGAAAGYNNPSSLTVAGSTLYFVANSGTQLWKTDGTDAGTVQVSNLGTGAAIAGLTSVGTALFFTAKNSSGTELWRSDGVTTTQVADLNPGAGDSTPSSLINVNGRLYFFANDGTGNKLWQATQAGVVSSVAALPSGNQPPTNLVAVGNRLFFVVDAGTSGSPSLQLWSSDGTSTAALVKDLNAGGNDAVGSLVNLDGAVFFTANDGTGIKVFRSDGTAAGTTAVSGNFTSVTANSLTVAGGKLFFAAGDATNGVELWVVQ